MNNEEKRIYYYLIYDNGKLKGINSVDISNPSLKINTLGELKQYAIRQENATGRKFIIVENENLEDVCKYKVNEKAVYQEKADQFELSIQNLYSEVSSLMEEIINLRKK